MQPSKPFQMFWVMKYESDGGSDDSEELKIKEVVKPDKHVDYLGLDGSQLLWDPHPRQSEFRSHSCQILRETLPIGALLTLDETHQQPQERTQNC